MKPAILISAPTRRAISRALARSGALELRWAYLGEDVREAEVCARRLAGRGRRLEIGPALQAVARQTRDDYIEYVGELSGQHASERWWLSSFSEKNPYVSKVFLQACYVQVVEQLAAENQDRRPLLLVAPDPAVRRCLAAHFKDDTGTSQPLAEAWTGIAAAWRDAARAWIRRGWFILKYLARLAVARALSPRLPEPGGAAPQTGFILLHSWIDRRCFDAEGRYRSINFGNLQDYLDARGRRCVVVPSILPTLWFPAGVLALRRSRVPFLLPERCLKVADVLWLAFSDASRPRGAAWPRFRGMDISALIDEDRRRDWLGVRYAVNALLGRAVERWREAGVPVGGFVYPFENHLWERAYCLAFRSSYPDATLLGYQDANLAPMTLNFFIAKGEAAVLPFPDRLIANGRRSFDLLRRSGYDPGRLRCGGALRYEAAARAAREMDEAAVGGSGPREGAPRRVLVTPSMAVHPAAELVWKALQALRGEADMRVVLKCHPGLPYRALARRLGITRLPAHFEVAELPLSRLLPEASVLLYADSTTCLEGLAAGVALVHVSLDLGLDLDPLDELPWARESRSDPEDLRQAVRAALSPSTDRLERLRRGRRLAAEFFGEVGEGCYADFLDATAGAGVSLRSLEPVEAGHA